MNFREAAEVFVDALPIEPKPSVEEVAHRMADLYGAGSARSEVQRWHEEAGHPKAGAHRCPKCLGERP